MMTLTTEETKIESNSLVLQEGRLLFQLGLRDEAHKYSNMGVDSLLGLASVEVVVGILEIAGADAWECLRGTSIRVRRDEATGAIKEIGHITEDTWVDIVQVNR